MSDKLSIIQAFIAMQKFLSAYYKKTLSDDLGSLLGGLQLSEDGRTWDSAMWGEWLRGLEIIDDTVTSLSAYKATQIFLEDYDSYISSQEIRTLLNAMELLPDGGTLDPNMWEKWQDIVDKIHKGLIKPEIGHLIK